MRWCGNEAGRPRASEWAVVPGELCIRCEKQTEGALVDGDMSGVYCTDKNIGNFDNIKYSKGLVFAPSEFDMSIRKGWFYHPDQEPHSVERLFNTYLDTVGHNGCLNLNIPPMPSGRFDERDVKRLAEFGEKLRVEFGGAVDADVRKISEEACGKCLYELTFPMRDVNYVIISEDLSKGQRIESFKIRRTPDELIGIYCGLTVGHKQICPTPRSKRTRGLEKLYIEITSTRGEVFLDRVQIC